ncbi:SUMF1/EgtB/PvdO family nonheme iron enzyme [Pedobacter nutrimenti]|nr:SUMF1/EgtB/PvdO family nonheme iron enzyme [Pedobacter nutrimenti]
MKNSMLYVMLLLITITSACNTRSYNTRQTRATSSKDLVAPPGMIYVPAGNVTMGTPGQNGDSTNMKKYRLSAFYMDKTSITNKQYRQFVYWVRDSIAITDYLNNKSYFQRMRTKDTSAKANINWDKVGDGRSIWRSKNYKIIDKLRPMYNQGDDNQSGNGELNKKILNFRYETSSADKSKSGYSVIKEVVNVWPDENVWDRDFPNSQNDLMVKSYFTNPSFDDYPVVGVTWKQARAFAAWRSKVWKAYNYKMKNPKLISLTMDLPTEAQRAYVSIPSVITNEVSIKDSVSKKKIKIKKVINPLQSGDSAFTYTMPVTYLPPNKFGLYNTVGNVSEWTLNTYTLSWEAFVHKINPVLLYDAKDSDPETLKRKVIAGSSWKDQATQNIPERQPEIQDEAKSYIGFRCVMPAPDFNPGKSNFKTINKNSK